MLVRKRRIEILVHNKEVKVITRIKNMCRIMWFVDLRTNAPYKKSMKNQILRYIATHPPYSEIVRVEIPLWGLNRAK